MLLSPARSRSSRLRQSRSRTSRRLISSVRCVRHYALEGGAIWRPTSIRPALGQSTVSAETCCATLRCAREFVRGGACSMRARAHRSRVNAHAKHCMRRSKAAALLGFRNSSRGGASRTSPRGSRRLPPTLTGSRIGTRTVTRCGRTRLRCSRLPRVRRRCGTSGLIVRDSSISTV